MIKYRNIIRRQFASDLLFRHLQRGEFTCATIVILKVLKNLSVPVADVLCRFPGIIPSVPSVKMMIFTMRSKTIFSTMMSRSFRLPIILAFLSVRSGSGSKRAISTIALKRKRHLPMSDFFAWSAFFRTPCCFDWSAFFQTPCCFAWSAFSRTPCCFAWSAFPRTPCCFAVALSLRQT